MPEHTTSYTSYETDHPLSASLFYVPLAEDRRQKSSSHLNVNVRHLYLPLKWGSRAIGNPFSALYVSTGHGLPD
jgi:hypothetical protein